MRHFRLGEWKVEPALLGWPGSEDSPVSLLDSQVVDAGFPAHDEPVGVELPQLVAVAAVPHVLRIMALVLETDRDPVALEGPQRLAQRVVQFPCPLGCQKRDDLFSTVDEDVPVAPQGLFAVGERNRSGSRVFQASSAACTLISAVSLVKGGSGGRSAMALSFRENYGQYRPPLVAIRIGQGCHLSERALLRRVPSPRNSLRSCFGVGRLFSGPRSCDPTL